MKKTYEANEKSFKWNDKQKVVTKTQTAKTLTPY